MSNDEWAVTPLDQSAFIALSSLLTGVGIKTLSQAQALIRSAEGKDFLDILIKYVGPDMALGQIVRTYDVMKGQRKSDQEIVGHFLLDNPDSPLSMAVRALMKLWYLGIWVQPYEYTAPDGTRYEPPDPKTGYLGSGYPPTIDLAMGYSQSMAWRAAQAHAIGDSDSSPFPLRFGYWAEDPPPLSVFIG